MGCGPSQQSISPSIMAEVGKMDDLEMTEERAGPAEPAVFKLLPSENEARTKFEQDGTLAKNSVSDHVALRTMLDEPVSQNALGKFAAKIQVLDIFMCWIDIQEYKLIPTESYRRSKALHIYHKYIKEEASLMIGGLNTAEREHYWQLLVESKDNPQLLDSQFYDAIQGKCFLDMYHNIYLPFKQTEEFAQLNRELKNKYNRVKVNDFDYYGKLGEGGFGFVVHCKKKSTGGHYAMKIQTKTGLLDCYRDEPQKVSLEKDAFASLQHPFIVNLHYAFQTPALVIMVLDLADCGDLHSCLNNSINGRLSEDRVRFYLAEIILALAYLHQRGLIYRDLKPQNVLLNADGHVQLVDLGGVMDDEGTWTEKAKNEYHSLMPLFSAQKAAMEAVNAVSTSPSTKSSKPPTTAETAIIGADNNGEVVTPQASPVIAVDTNQEHEPATDPPHMSPTAAAAAAATTAATAAADNTNAAAGLQIGHDVAGNEVVVIPKPKKVVAKRKQSIMGTLGYMAPEMVIMLSSSMPNENMSPRARNTTNNQDRSATKKLMRKGYTSAVDWWSLGVTAFKLLTGNRPFADKQMMAFVDMATTTLHAAVGENAHFKEYSMLFQKLSFPSHVSPVAKDFLMALLDVSDTTRLGSGPDGVSNIKRHPFFQGLDWELLEQKQILPPFVPPHSALKGPLMEKDLRSLLILSGKGHYMDQVLGPEDQKHFETWDFISPHTLRVEAGLSQMMEQLVLNQKARRIMGESDKSDGMMRPAQLSEKHFHSSAAVSAQPTPAGGKSNKPMAR